MEELSGQVEMENIKHSPASDHSLTLKDGESPSEAGNKSVRVVGMDEGTSKRAWIHRGFNLGQGPSKTEMFSPGSKVAEGGRLVLDEGKSQYMSNPFWATISEVSYDSYLIVKCKSNPSLGS